MSEYLIQGTTLTAIGDAIRNQDGSTGLIPVVDIPERIGAVGPEYFTKVWNKDIVEWINHKIVGNIPSDFQKGNTKLVKVDLPYITALSSAAFSGCNKLADVNLPSVTSISANAFSNCWELEDIILPSLTTFIDWGYTFNICEKLKRVVLPVFTGTITTNCFPCKSLTALVLGANTVCTLNTTNAFPSNTPIAKGTGYIYVRRSLIDPYKSASNWSNFASQFIALEDHPEILSGFPATFTVTNGDETTNYTVAGGTTWGTWANDNEFINTGGAIMNNSNRFLAPYGTTNYILSSDFVFTGKYWFVD